MKGMWQGGSMAQFKVLPWHLVGGTLKPQNMLILMSKPEFKHLPYISNLDLLLLDPTWWVLSFWLSIFCIILYCSSVFSSEGNIQHIQCANSGEPFSIDTKIIRKRVAAIRKIQINRAWRYFWRNPKTLWESHDSIPCAITWHNNE